VILRGLAMIGGHKKKIDTEEPRMYPLAPFCVKMSSI
jgi:hypothetical protein